MIAIDYLNFLSNIRKRKFEKQDLFFALFLFAAFLFSIWKCKYGFGGNDESFYLTIPHRLTLGDSLLVDEWHLSQLSGFLLYPFMKLYLFIFQSTDGILLFFRYFYLIYQLVVTLVIYSRFRKMGKAGLFSALLFFVFTPYDIMALSYNTMGLGLVTLTGVLLSTMISCDKKTLLICGVLFAGSVLCNPYLVGVYIIYTLFVARYLFFKRNKYQQNALWKQYFSTKAWGVFSLGVVILAISFTAFLFSRTNVKSILVNLPYLFKDPEHAVTSISVKCVLYIKTLLFYNDNFKYILLIYGIIFAFVVFDRKRLLHRSYYLLITAILVLLCYITLIPDLFTKNYNAIMFPLVLLGLLSFILSENRDCKIFVFVWLFGILYSVCMHFSSNQNFYVISMAMTVSDIASIIFIFNVMRELHHQRIKNHIKYVALSVLALAVIFQFGLQVAAKAGHVYKEENLRCLTYTIEEGPAKGLITTESNALNYKKVFNDLRSYNGKNAAILFATKRTWCYLCIDNMSYGTYSAWLSGENSAAYGRLLDYYSLHSDKVPKYIYIPKDSNWDLSRIQDIAKEYGYDIYESELSYKLEKVCG